MRGLSYWTQSERRVWFAAGDKALVKPAPRSASGDNSSQRLLFKTGLTFAVPLALAALVGIAFGT